MATQGAGASGLFAQSIGGGGGLGGDASSTFFTVADSSAGTGGGTGNGGTVNLTVSGSVGTSGANAAAVNAQSIGGGGGTAQSGTQAMNGSAGGSGIGGAVNVTVSGLVVAAGANSPGIFALSTGPGGAGPITIDILGGGTVIGGKDERGAGIMLSGGADNTITIASGASVSALGNVAILAGGGNEIVTNAGTVTGSVDLGTGAGSFINQAGGVFNSGRTINLNGGILTNWGTLSPGGLGTLATSTLAGNFVSTGAIALDLDATSHRSDLFSVSGTANVAGTLQANPLSIAPNTSFTVLEAGTLAGFTASVVDNSLVYQWNAAVAGNSVSLSPSADFTPPGSKLSANGTAAANHLQSIWNSGTLGTTASLFNTLLNTATDAQYRQALKALSPELNGAGPASRIMESRAVLNRTMSCPMFAGDGLLLQEDQCSWARVIVGRTSQSGTFENQGFSTDTVTLQAGVQRELQQDWFFALSGAYQQSWTSSSVDVSSASGSGFDVTAALKRQIGPWLISGAVDFGWVNIDSQRVVTALAAAPESSIDVYNVTGRLRLAYEMPQTGWYVRPYVDLDVSYVNVPGYSEAGISGAELRVLGASQTTFIVSPTVEVGTRVDLADGTVLRPFASLGASFLSNGSWITTSYLLGAPVGTGTFDTVTYTPDMLGNFDMGLQLVTAKNWEFKLDYGVSVGQDFLSQAGMARIAVHF
ncbi:MAG: autotransporter domain-containing protein [Pseudomonadota bacterium]